MVGSVMVSFFQRIYHPRRLGSSACLCSPKIETNSASYAVNLRSYLLPLKKMASVRRF